MGGHFITKREYVGRNTSEQWEEEIRISTEAPRTSRSEEIRILGSCGIAKGWLTTAYGEYETIEGAEAHIAEHWGEVRDVTHEYPAHELEYEVIVRVYKLGKSPKKD